MDADDAGLDLLARYPRVARHRLSADDYQRMVEVGILANDDRVELVEGELVAMAHIGPEHAGTVGALNRLLVLAVGERGVVFPQNPIRLGEHSVPQPDFAVLLPRPDGYRSSLPLANEVLLAVEVADSSLGYDRGAKLALYASHGVREVWIVNLPERAVEIHRDPVEGRYKWSTCVGLPDQLEIEALPGVSVAIEAIFG